MLTQKHCQFYGYNITENKRTDVFREMRADEQTERHMSLQAFRCFLPDLLK